MKKYILLLLLSISFYQSTALAMNLTYKDKCVTALSSPRVDSADYILLTTKILSEILDSGSNLEVDKKIKRIYEAFLFNNYDSSRIIINELISTIEEKDKVLHDLLVSKQLFAKQNDIPEKNQTRRYFETTLATELWLEQVMSEQSKNNQFKSMERLSAVITEEVNKLAPTASEEEIEMQSNYAKGLNLPIAVSSSQECAHILDKIHGGIDNVKHIRNAMKIIKDTKPENSKYSLYSTKDRNAVATNRCDYYTSNIGILKANSPMPQDERLPHDSLGIDSVLLQDEDTFKNKVTDTFEINKNIINGYSNLHTTVPFVNSISGTTYTLVYYLMAYTEEYKNKIPHSELENDISNIVNCFMAHSVKNGYHSMMEIHAVLTDVAVESFFKKHDIVLQFFSNSSANKAIKAATYYSITTNINVLINNQITEMFASKETIIIAKKQTLKTRKDTADGILVISEDDWQKAEFAYRAAHKSEQIAIMESE